MASLGAPLERTALRTAGGPLGVRTGIIGIGIIGAIIAGREPRPWES